MEAIKHEGTVVFQKGSTFGVKILRHSACSQCAAQNNCGLINSRDKIIEVETENSQQFTMGEDVIVKLEITSGYIAVFLCYILPLILMLTTMISVYFAGLGEIKSGISAIIILIPYYFWLSLNKKKLAEKIRFTLSKKE